MQLKDECRSAVRLEDELGDVIAKARAGRGLFAAQTARAADLSLTQLEDIEHYRWIPSELTLQMLADTLHLDPDKLITLARGCWAPRARELSTDSLFVKQVEVPVGQYSENAYIAACARTGDAAVIDPGGEIDQIRRMLQENHLTLKMVLITHAHGDHIGGLRELVSAAGGVAVACSAHDRDAVMRGLDAEWLPAEDRTTFRLGELSIRAIATPGHTQGSVCYAVEGACFVGDTLFAGSIGRPSSSVIYGHMLEAVRSQVLGLPGETILLPGHGPVTTVAEELEHNPFF